jgi:hypothetical protein
MAKLYLKGINKPITISLFQAKNIGKVYDDESVNGKLKMNVDGVRFSKEDIRNIIENDFEDNSAERSDTAKNENDSYYSEEFNKYNNKISTLCDRNIEDKIKDIKLYSLAWSCFTLKPMTEDFINEVIKRQRDFFSKYPKHPYASINILDLLPTEKSREDSIEEIAPKFITTKLAQIISESFNTAKFLRKI